MRHLMSLAVVSVFCWSAKANTTHPANEVGTQCGSKTLWCAFRHPSRKQYPVAAFTKLRPGIATEHQWLHFSSCHTIQHKQQQMLPTLLSDIDELFLSLFTPHGFMDEVSVGALEASEYSWVFSTYVRSDRYLPSSSICPSRHLWFGTSNWYKKKSSPLSLTSLSVSACCPFFFSLTLEETSSHGLMIT